MHEEIIGFIVETLKKDWTYFVQNRNDIESQVFGIIMDVLKKEESGEKRTAISLEEAVPKINKEEEE